MEENKNLKLPRFRSLDELVEFFDEHDWGDYWDQMPEAEFQVDLRRRVHLVALEPELADKLIEFAHARRASSEALINVWLREKLTG